MLSHLSCFRPFLDQQGFLVLDGGLATELEYLGLDLTDPLWSAKVLLENPKAITKVHQSYLEAGADMIISASYQASYPGLARRGLSRPAIDRLLQKSVFLARAARDQYVISKQGEDRIRPLVAASVGPYGAFLADGSEYTGNYGVDRATLRAFHAPRVAELIKAEPDLLAFETLPCLEEAEVLLELLQDYPKQEAYLSFSCRDGRHLSSGELFRDGVLLANRYRQVQAVGINCTAPQWITPLLRSVQDLTHLPFIVYPNRGEAWDAIQKCWIPGSAGAALQDLVLAWHPLGAKLVGGCCRVRPADIQAIRLALPSIRL